MANQPRLRHLYGMPGSQTFGLHDEFENRALGQLGLDVFGPVANHDNRPGNSRGCQRIEHELDHRPAEYRKQDFRQVGFHPGTHSGGQNNGGRRLVHKLPLVFQDCRT